MKITIRGEELELSAGRAIYWKREEALIVADMHLGKTGHFRQFGIPVPATLLHADLQRLWELLQQYQPKKLIVVGDMFHHQNHNADLDVFKDFRQAMNGLQVILVQGNHDRLKPLQYLDMDITLYKPNLNLQPFRFVHEHTADDEENFFSISGHIHPGVLLRGRAKQGLKLPCFAVNKNQLVLPAFSLFTGLDTSYCINECSFYAITGEAVFAVGS